jgi:hypothetical protein
MQSSLLGMLRLGGLWVLAFLGKKFVRTCYSAKTLAWWHMPVIPSVVGRIKYEDHVSGNPDTKANYFQHKQSKQDWKHGSSGSSGVPN